MIESTAFFGSNSKQHCSFGFGAIFAMAFLVLLATWPSAFAATFTVTNGYASGAGSLRQAVIGANNNPGKDTITIDPSVTRIVPNVLPSPDVAFGNRLAILESVDIIGHGSATLTIDDELLWISASNKVNPPGQTPCDTPSPNGGSDTPFLKPSDRIFQIGDFRVADNSSIEVTLQGFTLTRSGGLVIGLGRPSLRLVDVVVTGNAAADYQAHLGAVSGCDSDVINIQGNLEIIDSAIRDNAAKSTNYVINHTDGTLRIENSDIGPNWGLGVMQLLRVPQVEIVGSTLVLLNENHNFFYENGKATLVNSLIVGSESTRCNPVIGVENTDLALRNVTVSVVGDECPGNPAVPTHLAVEGGTLDIANTLLWNPASAFTAAPMVFIGDGVLAPKTTLLNRTNNFVSSPASAAVLGGDTQSGDPGLDFFCIEDASNRDQFCAPSQGSPLIDAGKDSEAKNPQSGQALSVDLAGNSRIDGAAVDIGAYERQQAAGSITIVKQATPKDGTNFNFILGGPGIVQQNFTVDDAAPDDNDGIGASKTVASLIPGTYLLSEQSVAGWHLEGITCTSDRPGSAPVITLPSVSIALHEAERVTCTFANQKQGSLTVVKKALGGDDTFNFGSNTLIPDSFPLTTTTGAAQITYNNLAPGRYDVGESTPPTGWTVAAATCDNGDDPGAIDIAPGANVTCTFENHKQNTIIIVKRAIGGDSTFNFTGGALGNFGLTTVNGEAVQAFGGLSTGTYSVAETASAGWTATVADPVCSNGNNASTINLASGQIVVCVFLSVAQDALVVEKKALGGDATFSFTSSSNAIGNFSLTTVNGGALRAFNSLPSGQYSVTETALPTGWDLTGNTCSSGVTLSPGGLATCTFTNTQRGAINIVKRTASGDGTFSFTSVTLGNFNLTTSGTAATQHFPNLRPSIYSVSENAQAGWEQSTATCSDGSSPTAIQLDPGETVTCTFTSAQDGRLIVVKNTLGGDATFAFTSTVSGHSSFNLTTANGTAASTFSDVKPGTYTVQEQPLVGWDSVSAQCSNGNKPDAVTLAAGQTVTCTFTNARKGTLVIRANTKNGDATFDFASRTLPQAAFALTTINGAASTQFNDLSNLKIYDITQTTPAGWVLLSATCDNGDLPGAVSIRPGATVICTFANRKANDIPTLSQWGLLVLAALLAFGAWSHGTMRSTGRR